MNQPSEFRGSSRLTFLSGGTGTPKLLDGLNHLSTVDNVDVSVIANVGDDIVLSSNLICPDIDSILYTLSQRIDKETWYGLSDDSYETHNFLHELEGRQDELSPIEPSAGTAGGLGQGRSFSGRGEFMQLGDRDRAVHIYRTALLNEGANLTEATQRLKERLGVEARVLPATNDPISTKIISSAGREMHFQEFWVHRNKNVSVDSVRFEGSQRTSAPPPVKTALEGPVVVGPSNPVTSIGPMLAVRPIDKQLRETFVLGVAPFVGDRVFSGPAGDLLEAEGYEASTRGWIDYLDFMDALLLDEDDPTCPSRPTFRTDLAMNDKEDRKRVAKSCFRILRSEDESLWSNKSEKRTQK